MAGWTRRAPIAFGLAFTSLWSCSLTTRFDGLSGGRDDGIDGGDAGADAFAAADADAAIDSGPPSPRAWRQVTVSGPPPRHSARMAFDSTRKRAVLFGGSPSNGVTSNETWEWDGAAWSRPMLNASPSSRRSPGLVYDSARRVVVVFAGLEGTPLAEPWQWDGGSTWTSSGETSTRPPVRSGAAMAYDAARKVIVVFGGQNPVTSATSAKTFEWSATAGFVEKTPAVSPPARRGHAMVYDDAKKRVVVYAGWAGADDLGDLWEWDGTTWIQRTASPAPPARTAPCAAYDSARRVLVVFGGRRGDGTTFDDTWEWDGQSWREGPRGPSRRRSCGITFDSERNAIVMYGGTARRDGETADTLADTWLYE
jgi:hypothetical protein